jgi:hypothetical protein
MGPVAGSPEQAAAVYALADCLALLPSWEPGGLYRWR